MSPSARPRVAAVTGAGRGLGNVIADLLAREGYALVVTGRDAAQLAAATRRFRQSGATVVPLVGDVTDPDHLQSIAAEVERLGGLDLLVNNAATLGTTPLPPLATYSAGEMERVYRVNVVAPVALVQALLPSLERFRGLVVNVSSDAALGGYPGWGAYGASKAALDLVSLTLAHELADRGVSVVAVDPGDMRTPGAEPAFPAEEFARRPLPEVTVPFWVWLLGQPHPEVSGRRFLAQGDHWGVTG